MISSDTDIPLTSSSMISMGRLIIFFTNRITDNICKINQSSDKMI